MTVTATNWFCDIEQVTSSTDMSHFIVFSFIVLWIYCIVLFCFLQIEGL